MKPSNLSELQIGEYAIIKNIITTGPMRRRFLDLGLIEGTLVKCVHKNPVGNPIAYSIRGALIAIRKEDSQYIQIEPLDTYLERRNG